MAVESEKSRCNGAGWKRGKEGGVVWAFGGGAGEARRASQDPRHDRCLLIRSDLQQLGGASDKKNKEMKEDEALIWKRLCSALPPPPLRPRLASNPERQTVRQCGVLNQPPPCLLLYPSHHMEGAGLSLPTSPIYPIAQIY